MNDLLWRKTPDGYQTDGYRIRQVDESPQARWRLEASPGPVPWPGSRQPTLSLHPSLRDARDRASRDEARRVLHARVTGHFVVAIVATVAFVGVSSTTLARSAAGFFSSMVLFYLALGSFADAICVRLGHPLAVRRLRGGADGLTWSARGVLALLEGPRRRYFASNRAEPDPAVLPLPPPSAG